MLLNRHDLSEVRVVEMKLLPEYVAKPTQSLQSKDHRYTIIPAPIRLVPIIGDTPLTLPTTHALGEHTDPVSANLLWRTDQMNFDSSTTAQNLLSKIYHPISSNTLIDISVTLFHLQSISSLSHRSALQNSYAYHSCLLSSSDTVGLFFHVGRCNKTVSRAEAERSRWDASQLSIIRAFDHSLSMGS